MSEQIDASSGGTLPYDLAIPSLTDGANIQKAFRLYHYGNELGTSYSSNSIAGYLELLAPKASPTFTGNVVLPSTTTIGSVSATELSYLDGASSNLQTQITANTNSIATNTTDIAAVGLATWFGDGSDGNVTVSSGTTTLTRDMFYDTLTISGTGKIDPAGFRIFVKTNLDLSNAGAGAISHTANNGSNAVSASGGSGGAGVSTTENFAYYGRSSNGGTGATGQTGTAGAVATVVAASLPIFYGNWIQSTGGGAIGALTPVTPATASTTAVPWRRAFVDLYAPFIAASGRLYGGAGGNGGNGAGKDPVTGTPGGGGGGGAAGNTGAFIYAKTITVGSSTADSAISFIGGTGGNGDAYDSTVGGGGGGGQGGIAYIVYKTKSGTMTAGRYLVNTSGGNGGTGYRGGQGGASGSIAMINLSAGTMTVYAATAGATSSTSTGGIGNSNKRNLV